MGEEGATRTQYTDEEARMKHVTLYANAKKQNKKKNNNQFKPGLVLQAYNRNYLGD